MGTFVELTPRVERTDPLNVVTAAWESDWLVSQRALSPNTVAAYTSDIRDFVSFVRSMGIATFNDITTPDIASWVAALIERGLSPSSFRARICALKDLYRYLDANGLADASVLPYIPTPKQHESQERPLDSEQELALWATYDTDTPIHERDLAEFAILDDLGLRESEVIALDLDDIRAKDNDIWVHGKGMKPRLIPIADDTLEIVCHYVKNARPYLKCSRRPQDKSALFLNSRGGRMTRQSIFNSVAAHGREAGIEHLHPHQLRRTFATQMYRHGVNLRAIQEMLGHADLGTTGIYITPDKTFVHSQYDMAVSNYWTKAAKKAEKNSKNSPTELSRRYWESLAAFDRERAHFELEAVS